MTNQDIRRIAMRQSALDLGCETEDFISRDNKVVVSRNIEGHKNYFRPPHFCHLTCYGNAAVASVDPIIAERMAKIMHAKDGYRCMEIDCLNRINEVLHPYGKRMGRLAMYFLPDCGQLGQADANFDIRILTADEIPALYGDDRFHMALGYTCEGDRRDTIAVTGHRDGRLMGVAGASNDSATMWQVGIDVIPEFRFQGVATTLVKIITNEIIARGIVPFYGIAWSNIASHNTAIRGGYVAAWTEVSAVDIGESIE